MSLPAVRRRHLDLMTACPKLKPATVLRRATAIRHQAAELGRWLEGPADRDVAQGIIDYWAGAIASLPDQPFPELKRLADFDPATGPAVEARARKVFEALSDAEVVAAQHLFLDLLNAPAPFGPKVDVPLLEAVRDRFAKAGVITAALGGQGFVIAHEGLLTEHWPQLGAWIADARFEEALVVKLSKSAILWGKYKRKTDLLLGDSLKRALPYRDRGPAITAYIDASSRRQRVRWATMALIAIMGVGAAALVFNRQESDEARIKTLEDNLDQVIAPSSTVAPDTAPVVDLGAAGPEGYIWIGGSGRALLRQYPSAKPALPDAIVKGGRYRSNGNIVLRTGYPDGDYQSAPRSGVIEPDAMVIALDKPRAMQRPSGPQYWLRVRKLVAVYIQYKGDRAQAEALRQRLLAQGYDVPGVEDMKDKAIPDAEVRFYRASEAALAQRLGMALNATLSGEDSGPGPSCKLATAARLPRPAVLEVWIDFTRPTAASPSVACRV
ncbi:hypothetical protein [Caulobacter rhizosphaerae]|uniref:nSTAND1 domain-containing NTPase n=1 Tax=Caulobacter rhizosphaerae TaxID=2010972 RepID=UPI0013D82337|nr:hypothetical protein [Caulobacter rhizosphaerae]